MIRGIGTSKGIGIGNALLIDIDNPKVNIVKVEDTQAEKERFKAAVEEFCNTTQTVMDELESNTALVMQNQIYLIKDPEMTESVNNIIDNEKICAEAAFDETCKRFISIFEAMDNETMNQRVADIEDLRNHVIDILMGVKRVDFVLIREP